MVDDKDDSIPDPWAGIEDEGGDPSDGGMTFSFDTAADVPDGPLEGAAGSGDAVGQPADSAEAPIFGIDSGEDNDPFESLKLDAAAEFEREDVAAWLEEPEAAPPTDPPLAVFPPAVSDVEESAPAVKDFLDGLEPFGEHHAADDVHAVHEGSPPAAGSSHVELGTGTSGVLSPSEVDPTSDLSASDDWADPASLEAADDHFPADVDAEPSPMASGFEETSAFGDAIPAVGPDAGHEAAEAGLGAAIASVATRPPRRKGGGLGQLVGIVLGGLMAIPITYAILLWGFQRDPFKLTAMLPQEAAFLLPEKFRPGSDGPKVAKLPQASSLDNLPAVPAEPAVAVDAAAPGSEPAAPAPTEPEPSPADPAQPEAVVAMQDRATTPAGTVPMESRPAETRADEPAGKEPGAGEPASETPLPPPFDDVAAAAKMPVSTAPVEPPEPEPLDTAALDAAIGEAAVAFEELSASDPESPERRTRLRDWYKRLAAVAEQLVLLEKVAVDSGRSLDGAVGGVAAIGEAVGADPAMQAELAKLSGMWLESRRRPADGTVLLATFEGTRQVGPYWSSRITVQGTEPRSVAVISRAEPRAESGETVMVTGVLFDDDVVWASDCRTLVRKSAKAEDLF